MFDSLFLLGPQGASISTFLYTVDIKMAEKCIGSFNMTLHIVFNNSVKAKPL